MINKEIEPFRKDPRGDSRIPKIMDGNVLKILGDKYKDIIMQWAPKIIKVLDDNDGEKAMTTHTYNGEIVRSSFYDYESIQELVSYFEKEFGYKCDEILITKNWVTSIPEHSEGWLGENIHYGGNRFHPDRFNAGSFKFVTYLTDTNEDNAAFNFLAPHEDWFFAFDELIGTERQGTIVTHMDEDAKNAQVITVSGQAGSSFLFSTGLVHSGDYARKKPRYILILGFNYLNTESLKRVEKGKF
jgi:hypothetical protein